LAQASSLDFLMPTRGNVVIPQGKMKDNKLARLFANCLPNTLDTTFSFVEDPEDTFVITGDIHAMWLRDSTNQVWPYLKFLRKDARLKKAIRGLVSRQAKQINVDVWANAFNKDPDGAGHSDDIRIPPMQELTFEGKYELDSLAAFLRLSNGYYNATADASLLTPAWEAAVEAVLRAVEQQQASSNEQVMNPLPNRTVLLHLYLHP
jgi:hypothetical protein